MPKLLITYEANLTDQEAEEVRHRIHDTRTFKVQTTILAWLTCTGRLLPFKQKKIKIEGLRKGM